MNTLYSTVFKRYIEALLALIALIVLSPLLLLCAVAIKFDSCGPVLFKQTRSGQYGRPFEILKFRTMVYSPTVTSQTIAAAGDARITRLGRWLRILKIDELPQFVNVLRGEMSIVGPRPELPKYTVSYSPRQQRVLSVRPGITGPASLKFANEERLLARHNDRERFYVSHLLPTKLEIDLAYCEKPTFGADIKLILRTLINLFSGEFYSRPVV